MYCSNFISTLRICCAHCASASCRLLEASVAIDATMCRGSDAPEIGGADAAEIESSNLWMFCRMSAISLVMCRCMSIIDGSSVAIIYSRCIFYLTLF